MTAVDPYELLDVPRDATAEQVRQAYRNAALKYHPDCCDGDPEAIIGRFCAVTAAYRAILRNLAQAGGNGNGRACTPEAQAAMADEWLFVPFDRKDPAQRHWHRHPGVWRHVAPTRNENRFFAGCWVLAVAAALGVLAAYAHAMRSRAASAQDAAAMLLLSLGAYALATAVSLKALLMTRRIIWMILRRGLFGRPVLPRPGDERDLPRAASARLKHPAEPVSSPRRGGRT